MLRLLPLTETATCWTVAFEFDFSIAAGCSFVLARGMEVPGRRVWCAEKASWCCCAFGSWVLTKMWRSGTVGCGLATFGRFGSSCVGKLLRSPRLDATVCITHDESEDNSDCSWYCCKLAAWFTPSLTSLDWNREDPGELVVASVQAMNPSSIAHANDAHTHPM